MDEEMENQDKQKGETSRENAFKTFDVKELSKIPRQQHRNWRKVGAIKNDSGQLKYP